MKRIALLCLLLTSIAHISAQDLTLWGYSLSDEFGYSGYGSIQYYNPPLSAAIWVPGDGNLKGAKIHAINIPITSDDYTKISVWGTSSIQQYSTTIGPKVFEKAYNGAVKSNAFLRIDLDQPVSIPATGFFVGYTFTTSFGYPFGRAEGYAAGSSWEFGWGGRWYDVSDEGQGVVPIQLWVSDMKISGNDITIESVKCRKAESGKEAVASVGLSSSSEDPVKSITYTINFSGKKETRTITLPKPIEEGLAKKATVKLGYKAPATNGQHAGTISITEVNGKPNLSKAEPFAFSVNTVEEIIPRLTIVEEYTGTGCPNCPRGWLGMKHVKEEMADHAAVISIHNYNLSDPMYCTEYAAPEFDGAPSCHIDRTAFNMDPYYGNTRDNIYDLIDQYNDIAPLVKVGIEAQFTDASNSAITMTANTHFLTSSPGSQIAFVLTADELYSTSRQWGQSNNLSETDPQGMGELAMFCKDGEYGESLIFIPYDDVLIGSSWTAEGANTAPAFTSCALDAEEHISMTLTPSLSAALKKVLHYDKIYATAIVFAADGKISNAARCRVLPAGEYTGIESLNLKHNSSPVYDLQGRSISNALKGIYIQDGRKMIK